MRWAALWAVRTAFGLALKVAEVVDDHSGSRAPQRRQPAAIHHYGTPVRRGRRRTG